MLSKIRALKLSLSASPYKVDTKGGRRIVHVEFKYVLKQKMGLETIAMRIALKSRYQRWSESRSWLKPNAFSNEIMC